MTRPSRKIADTFISILNDCVDAAPDAKQLLETKVGEVSVLNLINTILAEIAEGATLLTAREANGELAGFVMKRLKPPSTL